MAEAVKGADVVMMLLPGEQIAEVYRRKVHENAKKGASRAFAHGFNIHCGYVIARGLRRYRGDSVLPLDRCDTT
jgi:ketol-acid reductoisomerase